jgi:hypothetical protein
MTSQAKCAIHFSTGSGTLPDSQGKKVKLKPSAKVDVTIEADKKDTVPENENE